MSFSFSDSSTLKVSKFVGCVLPCEVVHLFETTSANSKSSSESYHVSGQANVGGVAGDVCLSVDPVVSAAELDALPVRATGFEWVDSRVQEHSSRFGTTASQNPFSASIDMLDLEALDEVISL